MNEPIGDLTARMRDIFRLVVEASPNAIVLVDYINLKRREDGMDPHAAAIAAAQTRLRPILMTTSTTVLGLLPLALGWGEGAGLQAALARVVVGGLVASTIVTLFLIPALYISATAWADRARLAIAGAASWIPALRASSSREGTL